MKSVQVTGLPYRLASVRIGDLAYTYDRAGNRIQFGGSWARTGLPQPVTSATYNAADQILSWGTQGLTHDLNGNLTNDGTTTYAWDARNQLASMISVDEPTVVQYRLPSVLSMSTRTFAAVAERLSRIRTL